MNGSGGGGQKPNQTSIGHFDDEDVDDYDDDDRETSEEETKEKPSAITSNNSQ